MGEGSIALAKACFPVRPGPPRLGPSDPFSERSHHWCGLSAGFASCADRDRQQRGAQSGLIHRASRLGRQLAFALHDRSRRLALHCQARVLTNNSALLLSPMSLSTCFRLRPSLFSLSPRRCAAIPVVQAYGMLAPASPSFAVIQETRRGVYK